MTLKKYIKKRDFSKTKEPKPAKKIKKSKKTIFVVQEHHASHLHWDFRLEINGVLKSWALPKMPVKTKRIKRLAVPVEDHPLSYARFHGTIPEGQYGAGKVKIWDKGTYEMQKKTGSKLVFTLKGKKLKGDFCLIKFKTRQGKPAWLFFRI